MPRREIGGRIPGTLLSREVVAPPPFSSCRKPLDCEGRVVTAFSPAGDITFDSGAEEKRGWTEDNEWKAVNEKQTNKGIHVCHKHNFTTNNGYLDWTRRTRPLAGSITVDLHYTAYGTWQSKEETKRKEQKRERPFNCAVPLTSTTPIPAFFASPIFRTCPFNGRNAFNSCS
jgi:hypothetical protein